MSPFAMARSARLSRSKSAVTTLRGLPTTNCSIGAENDNSSAPLIWSAASGIRRTIAAVRARRPSFLHRKSS